MSLLQQLVETIGESMGVEYSPEEKSSPEPQKQIDPAEDDSRPLKKKETENRDDSSSNKEERKEGTIEISNIEQAVQKSDTGSRSGKSDDCSASNSSVSFGSVQVREYERVIDSTNIYMGLALGWNYNDMGRTPIKERNRTSKYSVTSTHGGDESKMKRTNGSDRYGMMIRYGYAQKELKQATKEAAKFYKQRQREAARSIVVAEERTKQTAKPKRRPLLRSMFG